MGTDLEITLDEYATTLIRIKARQLIGRYGFSVSDREDIQQELTLDLLTRIRDFDPRKGRPATYIRMVVDRRVATLIRERTSRARDYRRARHSLEDLRDGRDTGEPAEPAVDVTAQRDLAIDLTDALGVLSDDLRAIAAGLREESAAAVARRYYLSRDRMRRCVGQIRTQLEQCGLGCSGSPRSSAAAARK